MHFRYFFLTKLLWRSTLLLALVLLSTAAASLTSQPVFKPELSITETPTDIKVDGDLADPGWAHAALIGNFVERYPADNAAPEVETRTYVTYDKDHLYVAFVCLDDPALIRATMCQRDQFSGDDAIVVLLDTYGDASWAYEFFVNPYGVQKDYLWSSVGGDDPGFDLTWEAAARITDSGYQVEMAVPFSGMRFPNREVQSWKMDFWRNRPRESFHQYSWAAYDRNESCWPCQWGTVSGLRNVRPGKGLEILPSYVAFQSGQLSDASDPHSGFDNGDLMGELSLGAKYAASSDVTLEASYNPDFSQIEADAAQVSVNTTVSLFYPERRPFFQEGADVFRTLFNSFYTRTVNDPEYAVKLVSRKPGFTLGFMSAQDETTPYMVPLEEASAVFNTGRSWVNVVRGSKPLGEASRIGFLMSDRRLEGGGYGSILAGDGMIRLNRIYSIDGQFITSFTGEPDQAGASEEVADVKFDQGQRTAEFDGESFRGNAFITQFRRFARHWSFILDYNQVDPSYRTETGYDPWVDYRNASIWTQYTFYSDDGFFQRIQPQIYTDVRWRFDGVRRWEHQNFSLHSQLRWAQTDVSLTVSRGSETWTNGVTGLLTDYNGLYSASISGDGRISNELGFYGRYERGRGVARFADAIGTEDVANVSLDIKPIDRLVIEPDISFVRSKHVDTRKELYRQFIARTRFRLQVNRELSLRLVLQYNDGKANIHVDEDAAGPVYYEWRRRAWDIDPLLTYRLSSFSVLYLGSTHDIKYFPGSDAYPSEWQQSARQFFVKLQYLFQA